MYRIIDTNLTIRYVMQDDIEIARKVKELVDQGVQIIPESIVENLIRDIKYLGKIYVML